MAAVSPLEIANAARIQARMHFLATVDIPLLPTGARLDTDIVTPANSRPNCRPHKREGKQLLRQHPYRRQAGLNSLQLSRAEARQHSNGHTSVILPPGKCGAYTFRVLFFKSALSNITSAECAVRIYD